MKKYNVKTLTVLFLVFALAGCSSTQFSPAAMEQTLPVAVEVNQVKVFSSGHPEGPYQEIGLLHFKGASDLETAISSMKEKAAAQGGNGIIDIKVIAGGVVGTLVLIE